MLPAAVRSLRRRCSWYSGTLAENVLPLSNRVTNKSLQVAVLHQSWCLNSTRPKTGCMAQNAGCLELRLPCMPSSSGISAFILVMCNWKASFSISHLYLAGLASLLVSCRTTASQHRLFQQITGTFFSSGSFMLISLFYIAVRWCNIIIQKKWCVNFSVNAVTVIVFLLSSLRDSKWHKGSPYKGNQFGMFSYFIQYFRMQCFLKPT